MAVQLVSEQLRAGFKPTHTVRVQIPLAIGESSEPEPDIAVVTGSPRDYRDAHRRAAVLIVEVADTSLSLDREHKKRLYAQAHIPEYWIIDLADRQLEAYQDPADPGYRLQTVLRAGDFISPGAAPDQQSGVTDLLP